MTTSLLDNEAPKQASNQLVTYSEIKMGTSNNQCVLPSKEKEREDLMTLFSE